MTLEVKYKKSCSARKTSFFMTWLLKCISGAFTLGLLGGGLFGAISGARNAPTGLQRRALGGLVRLKEKGPMFGKPIMQ